MQPSGKLSVAGDRSEISFANINARFVIILLLLQSFFNSLAWDTQYLAKNSAFLNNIALGLRYQLMVTGFIHFNVTENY